MSKHTKIEWCDHTWNPWRGCTKVSPGCANCYAETLSKRNPSVLGQWGKGKPRVLAKNWNAPVKWNQTKVCTNCGTSNPLSAMVCESKGCAHFEFRRPRVFPSLCDWLDDEVPIEWLARFLILIRHTPNLEWLLLTKRPELWGRLVTAAIQYNEECRMGGRNEWLSQWLSGTPPPNNVWIGASVEDQTRADERIPELLKIPAKLRLLSVEPMLGPIEFSNVTRRSDAARQLGKPALKGIDWVKFGGESGPSARPCDIDWIRSGVRQCAAASVPCFVERLGAKPEVEAPSGGWMQPVPVRHPKGGDPSEWPEDLRVRQMPEVKP